MIPIHTPTQKETEETTDHISNQVRRFTNNLCIGFALDARAVKKVFERRSGSDSNHHYVSHAIEIYVMMNEFHVGLASGLNLVSSENATLGQ